MYTLGIDIGTTSICIVLYDVKNRTIAFSRNVSNRFLAQGSFWQDADEIVSKVSRLLEEMEELPFEAIGISSQMHGIVYVNGKGEAVSPFYTWKEESGNQPLDEKETYAGYLSRITGYPLYTGYGSVTHFYLQKTGALPADAEGFVDIGDYLAMRLTGSVRRAVNESIAASFGGYDLENRCFDHDALKKAGVDVSFYPEICPYHEFVGYYKGKKVFSAIGDHQASFLGAVSEPEKSIGINVGTGSQVSVYSPKLCLECMENGTDVRPFPGGGYLYVGASLNGGKVYERLAAFFGEICERFTGEKPDIYAKMQEIAMEKEDTDLKAYPNLYGARGGKPGRSGWDGLNSDNFHPADMIRSYLRGMASELKALYDVFSKEIKQGRESLSASGNGLRKNPLLCQEMEKAFELPVTFSRCEEEAAAGAAVFAAENNGNC